MNEYDQMLEDLDEPKQSNPYDQMLQEEDRAKERALQTSAIVAADAQPDRRAEVLKLSERYKLAPELVENNFDTLNRKSKIESIQPDKLVRDHRGLADWLSDPNNAALSADELDKLKGISETINDRGELEKMYLTLGYGFANLNSSIAKIPALATDIYTQYAVNPLARTLGYAEVKPNEALRNNAVTGFFDKSADGLKAQVPELSEDVLANIEGGNFGKATKALAYQVVANLPQQAVTIGTYAAGAPAAGLALMAGSSAATEYDQAKDQGVDTSRAINNAIISGSAEALFESLGTLSILKKWEATIGAKYGKDTATKIMKDVSKMIVASSVQEGVEEAGTSLTQDVSKMATGVDPNLTIGEVGRNMVNSALIGAASGGAITAPSGAAIAASRRYEMNLVQQTVDFHKAIGEKVKDLKLRKRLPEASQKLIENLTKDGPVENVFITPDDFRTYFQSKGMDAAEAAQLYGVAKEYQEAKETGADIKIPLAKFANNLVETEHYQGLAGDIRYSETALSANQLKAEETKLKADLKLLSSEEEVFDKPDVELTLDERRVKSARAIQKNIEQQILALNSPMYGPNEAKQMALLYGQGFNTLAVRSGQDPMELFNRYGLRIALGEDGKINEQYSRPGDSVMAAQGQVLNQRSLVKENEGDLSGEIKGKGKIGGTLMSADGAEFWFESGNKSIDDVPYESLAILESVEVDPSARRQGVASKLIKDFEKQAQRNGAQAVYLNASPMGSNKVSIDELVQFYKANGYKVFDDMKTNVIMFKELSQPKNETQLFQSAAQAVADQFVESASASQGSELFQSQPKYGEFKAPAGVKSVAIASLTSEKVSVADAKAAVLGDKEYVEYKAANGAKIRVTERAYGKMGSEIEGEGSEIGKKLSATDKAVAAVILKNLPKVIPTLIYDNREPNKKPDKKPDVDYYKRYYAQVAIDGTPYMVHLKTEVTKKARGVASYERVYLEYAQKLETPALSGEPDSGEGLKIDSNLRSAERPYPVRADITIGEFVENVNSVRASDPYFQSDAAEDSPRGRIVIRSNRTMRIEMFAKADLSTFLHETGHFYLEVLGDLAKDPNANPQLVADYNTAITELGGTPGGPITVEMHEKWARAFELYLAKGEAPSLELKKAFAHFKVWLLNIYKNLARLDVELTPELKGVMDRMLATDEQLQAAYYDRSPLFKEDAFASMNEETVDKYKAVIDDARREASEALTAKVVEREFKKREAAYKEKRKAVRARVEEEANGLRIYRALSILQKGTLPDGSALPEGTPEIKIDKDSIVQAYGKEFLNRLPRPYIYAKSGGVDFNMAAEMLGFESGDAMLTEMANTQSKKEYVEARTDQEMDVLYPDEVMEQFPAEAVKAAHSKSRAKLLRMELEILASENMPILKDAIRRVARRVPTEKEVRAQARQMISGKKTSEIKPYVFERAEVRSAKEAGIALANGDIAGAFEAKRRELLNHELFLAAEEALESHEKAEEFFKKFNQKDEDLAKTRDIDLVAAGRAILSEYGIGRSEKTSAQHLEYMKRYSPENYESIEAIISGSGLVPGRIEEITHEEFEKMNETVRAIWALSKQARNMTIDGKKVEREQIKAELIAHIDSIKEPGQRVGYDKAVTDWEKTKIKLQGMRAALRRVESWVSAVDGDFGGPFRKYIWQPISDATAVYRSEKQKTLTILQTIVKDWAKDAGLTNVPIRAEAIGYTFSGKAELMAAILHTGNKSNFEKLLLGRGWGALNDDGALDTSRWSEFMAKMYRDGVIAKTDMDFAQRIWDLNELLKPEAQKAHKEMYGFYFNEVTADIVETPFGAYRGGYVPAITDTVMVEDSAIRQEQEATLKGNNSFMFPTTGRGFTKSRVEQYHAPLSLDLRLIGSHVDKILRFIHIEPRVKEVARVVMDKKFRSSLAELDPTIGQDMLVPWLQRAAQQAVSTPSKGWGGKGLDAFARELRKRAGLQTMFFNVTNTMQQITGFSIAAVRVRPRYLRNAMWRYLQGSKAFADDVVSKSKFMETRTASQMVDINQTIEDLSLNPSKFEDARAFIQKHGYFMQSAAQNLVDLTVWGGAYENAIEDGMSESDAVRFADSAVRETQGSMNPEDISRFEGGSPLVRLFTMFQGYFNMQSNLLGTEFVKIARDMGLRKGAGRLFYLYVMGFTIPAVMSELIVRAMGNGIDEDDDDEYLTDMLGIFFFSQFNTATAMLPAIGPTVKATVSAMNDKPYDDRISVSPVVQAIERSVQAPNSVYQAIANDGSKRKAVRDLFSAIGMISGVPTGPLQRPLSYLADVDEGRAEPTGPLDFGRGLITGQPGSLQ